MTDLEPMPPELRALIASERDVSGAERAAIRGKLEASIGSAAPATPSALAGRAAWLAVAGLVTAAAIWFATRDGAPAPTAPAAPQLSVTAEPELVETGSAREPAPPPGGAAEPAPARSASTSATSQAELLARAWRALARDDAATTLQLLAEDRRLHPGGALSEEREAMHVRALAAAKRGDEARAHAKRFLERWPSSVHRPVIEQVMAP